MVRREGRLRSHDSHGNAPCMCALFDITKWAISCFMAGKPPAARRGHVAAAVEDKVYVWGGLLGYAGVSHDGPDKTDIIVKVDVLDLKVRRGAALPHVPWD